MNRVPRHRRAAAFALTLLVAAAAVAAGCRDRARENTNRAVAQPNATQGDTPPAAAPEDVNQLNADIERLEKQAERNPADEETQDELARVYVKRARVEQGAGRLQDALTDYQRALRHDPDSDDAQGGAAAMEQQLGGDQQEDENGAPAPLPITPNVADEDGKSEKPTPTPRKQ